MNTLKHFPIIPPPPPPTLSEDQVNKEMEILKLFQRTINMMITIPPCFLQKIIVGS